MWSAFQRVWDYAIKEWRVIREAPAAFVSCVVLASLVIAGAMYEVFSWRYGRIIDLQRAAITELQNEKNYGSPDRQTFRAQNGLYVNNTEIGMIGTSKIDLQKHLVIFDQVVSAVDLDRTPEIEFREYTLQPDKHGDSGMTALAGFGTRYSYANFQFRIVGERPH